MAGRPVEDGGDMRRMAGNAYGVRYPRTVYGFGPQNPGEVPRRDGRHVAASGSSRRGEATDEEVRWPSDEDDTGLDHNALELSGLTQ